MSRIISGIYTAAPWADEKFLKQARKKYKRLKAKDRAARKQKFKRGETLAGRKDASAPARRHGENNPAERSDELRKQSGVGCGKSPGNSPSDDDGATMSRAPEAPPMSVAEDR